MATTARRKRKVPFLIILALLVAVIFGLPWACQRIEAPWSVGGPEQPTLTRTWEGPLAARLGAKYRLLVSLDYKELTHRSRRGRGRGNFWKRNNLTGTARLCTPKGQRWDYEVSGRADRDGTGLLLRLEYGDPSQSGLDLELRGAYEGERVAVTANKNPFLRDGTFKQVRTVSSADPDDSFAPIELRPGTREAFEAACR